MARQIVLVTDGEVTNTDAILAVVRKHEGVARIFTFGIGAGPSHHLVRGLARAGGGAAEFILPGRTRVGQGHAATGTGLSPAFTNVRLDWGGLEVTQAPSVVPPISVTAGFSCLWTRRTPRGSGSDHHRTACGFGVRAGHAT